MLNNIKASLLRYCDMSWSALTELKRLLQQSAVVGSVFDVESLSNPSLRIAQATNAVGQVICFCPIEQAVVINPLAFNPKATEIEMYAAGAAIEAELAHQAALSGVSKLLMVVPDNMPSMPGERFIRIVERKIVPAVITQGIATQTTQALHHSN